MGQGLEVGVFEPCPESRIRMRVSVVAIAYNIEDGIEPCLNSILKQDFSDYEVIVVDDGSTDGTAERARKYPVRLIRQSNRGIAGARNAGADVSQSEILIFLDGDCTVEKNFITRMVEPLSQAQVGMTQGYIDIANPGSLTAQLIFTKARYVFRNLEYLDFSWGGCVAIRKNLFERLGRFGELIKFVEDDDLAYRMMDQGYKICLAKEAKFFHPFPESLWKHLVRNARTARWMVRLIGGTGRFTTRHGSLAEYSRLLLHGLTLLALIVVPWTPIPFLILVILSMVSHLRLGLWAMKKDVKYILIIPFEFLTKISWVVGSTLGLWDVLLGRRIKRVNSLSSHNSYYEEKSS